MALLVKAEWDSGGGDDDVERGGMTRTRLTEAETGSDSDSGPPTIIFSAQTDSSEAATGSDSDSNSEGERGGMIRARLTEAETDSDSDSDSDMDGGMPTLRPAVGRNREGVARSRADTDTNIQSAAPDLCVQTDSSDGEQGRWSRCRGPRGGRPQEAKGDLWRGVWSSWEDNLQEDLGERRRPPPPPPRPDGAEKEHVPQQDPGERASQHHITLKKIKNSLSTSLGVARGHNSQADKDDRAATATRSTLPGAAPPTVIEKIFGMSQQILRAVRLLPVSCVANHPHQGQVLIALTIFFDCCCAGSRMKPVYAGKAPGLLPRMKSFGLGRTL
jgi:hypothetical protein